MPGQRGDAAGRKSVVVAYLLYFIGWWCGAHHWYLERDAQAYLWMVSFGGFGFGAFCDFFRLYDYVQEANATDGSPRRPGILAAVLYWIYCSWFAALLSGQHPLVALVLSRVLALPALAFGRRRLVPQLPGSSHWALGLALAVGLSGTLSQENAEEPVDPWAAVLTAVLCCWQGTIPDGVPTTGRRSGKQRLGVVATILAGCCVWALVTEVDSMDGGRTTVAEQLFTAGEWLHNVYTNFNKMDWDDAFRAASTGERGTRALLRTLELEPPTTWKAIKSQYRKLSRANHPDLGGDAEKMGEINKAYEALKNIYALKGTATDYDFDEPAGAEHAGRNNVRFQRRGGTDGGSGATFEFKFGR